MPIPIVPQRSRQKKQSLFESHGTRTYIYPHELLIFNGKCRIEYVPLIFFKENYVPICIILHLVGFPGIFTSFFLTNFMVDPLGGLGSHDDPPLHPTGTASERGLAAMATASVEAKRCSSRCI